MRTSLLCICLATAPSAHAQSRPDSTRRDSLPRPGADSARREAPPKALPTLQVTATAVATDARRIAQPTALLAGATLRRAQGASLGETLEQIPGVRSLSMTTGIGKPVIRGLTNNRVVTLANGQRTETQQWGHDHSPNVESADAERLEVVKGPASVLYGSDALGGVVNVVRRALPTADGTTLVRGRLALAYNSANAAPSATVVGEGAVHNWGWRLTGTSRRASDLRTPGGTVFNTGNRTSYVEGATGWRSATVDAAFTASSRDETIRMAADPRTAPGYDGRQRIRTRRATADATLTRGRQRVHVQAGFEENRRAEFANAATPFVDLGLRSRTATSFANWHHAPWRGVAGTLGVAAQETRFRTFGRETLIPDNSARALGLYLLEQTTRGAWSLSGGVRHDWRTLSTPGSEVLRLAPTARAFNALTGTLGTVYRAESPVSIAVNVARGFRSPSASDLFANGFHEGTRAFEIGQRDLRVETSLNTDVGVRLRTSRASGELTGYVNRIRDYIYLTPVGAPGRALDSLQVRQGNAQLVGVEAALSAPLSRGWSASTVADMVHAANRSDGSALPFVPPFRVSSTLRWDERAPGRSLSVSGEWNARQSRTFRSDYAPPAYALLHASAGSSHLTARGLLHVDVSVRNLLNSRYRDFMSRYKEFADAAGRALVVRVGADF